MPKSSLTPKSRRFAKLVAAGVPKTVSFAQVYDSRGGNVRTRRAEAQKLAAKPAVRALIERYEEQLMPLGDLRSEMEAMLCNIRTLATDSPDHRVRLLAAKTFYEICERREERAQAQLALPPAEAPVSVEQLVDELLAISASPDAMELEVATDDPENEAQSSSSAEGY